MCNDSYALSLETSSLANYLKSNKTDYVTLSILFTMCNYFTFRLSEIKLAVAKKMMTPELEALVCK